MALYAVVGATGQIGGEVARLLHDAGDDVRALVRDRGRARERLPPSVELVEGDMADTAQLGLLLRDIAGLFVVSSDPAAEPPVYQAAGRERVPLVVKSSAIGFGAEPPADHAQAEAALRRQPIEWAVLRPNAFMQTLRSYLPSLIDRDGSFALPAGDGASAWVDTRDIAAIAVATLHHGPSDTDRVLSVTGPAALTVHDVAAIVSKHAGVQLRYQPISLKDGQRQLAQRLGPMGNFLAEHYAAVAAGGFAAVSDAVPRLLGQPARELDALVTEHPESWKPRTPKA